MLIITEMTKDQDSDFFYRGPKKTYYPADASTTDTTNTVKTHRNTSKNVPNKQINKKRPPPQPKKKKMWKKGVAILIVAGLLIALFFGPLNHLLSPLWMGPVYPETAEFTIERTITFDTNRDINYQVNTPFPIDIIERDIQYINYVDWGLDYITGEKFGRDWVFWEDSLEGDDSEEIRIRYRVETRTVKWDYNSQTSGTVDDIEQGLKDRYNQDQWAVTDREDNPVDRNGDGRYDVMIEPSHPSITNLAEQLTEDKDNVYDKSRAIYRWITNNINYERGDSRLPQHAYWTLNSQQGDCDEQSFLFISLARAVDIPAWIELGIMYDRTIDEWGGHGWIRMQFVDNEGNSEWINIDTTNRQFFARDATRITTWTDDGIGDHLEAYYYFFNYNYTSSGPPPQVSVNDQYENLRMDTEGQVYIGDEDSDLPSVSIAIIVPFVAIFSFIWERRKKR